MSPAIRLSSDRFVQQRFAARPAEPAPSTGSMVLVSGGLTVKSGRCSNPTVSDAAKALGDFIADHRPLAVISGAGVSTGSGIPDYRDRNGDWKHAEPIQYGEFIRRDTARQRYWSRSYVGWQRFSAARPNAAHHALAVLEQAGHVDTLITQNVDRLHSRAGSHRVIDLHGDLGRVRCLDCDRVHSRREYQRRLGAANPDWHAEVFRFRPDGDAELAADSFHDFRVPGCEACAGMMKPDVVMFGEAVPKARVADAAAAVERATALLVVGSSLMVFSGFRFARQAHALGKPIAIVNHGRTRADDLATLLADEDCGELLSTVVAGSVRSGPPLDEIEPQNV